MVPILVTVFVDSGLSPTVIVNFIVQYEVHVKYGIWNSQLLETKGVEQSQQLRMWLNSPDTGGSFQCYVCHRMSMSGSTFRQRLGKYIRYCFRQNA